jgi:hypothetical protein
VTTVALYVMSPLHVIAQLTALRCAHPGGDVKAHLIVHWPHASDGLVRELAGVIDSMTATAPEIYRRTVVTQSVVDEVMTKPSDAVRYATFAGWLGSDVGFDEIYFAHDVGGLVYQLLAGAYPQARRITTGENLGHVFERRVYYAYLQAPPSHKGIKDRLNQWIFADPPGEATVPDPLLPDKRPHRAMLLLPVDQSGHYLDDLELVVPDRRVARETASACAADCAALRDYIRRLLSELDDRPAYVLCMQNFAECGTVRFEDDVSLWCDIVRRHCRAGSTVMLKSHPAESFPRGEGIAAALGDGFNVVQLDPRFARYPIELWEDLVCRATVITGSMPLLSLKYLYDVDAIQPFTDEVMERRFPRNVWTFYKNGLSLFTGPLGRYPSWDGSSVLWRGTPPAAPRPRSRAARRVASLLRLGAGILRPLRRALTS